MKSLSHHYVISKRKTNSEFWLMKVFLIGLSVFFWLPVSAQQDPLYSQYITNPFVINPAYAGLTNNLNFSLNYRNQWAGFDGSPKTINFNGHISLRNNQMGAGLMVVSDQIGNSKITEIFGSYSYRINLTDDKILSFGLQAGMANYQIDNSKVNPFHKDDDLFLGNFSETKPSFGFGAILKNDKFMVGLSVPRMLRSTLETQGKQATLYTQHYYLLGSYLFFISEHVRFKPATMIKMVSGAPLSMDLNASFILHENYQAGLLTRNFNTYGLFMQGLFKDSIRIGYVFEVPTGSAVGANFSTHEICIGYRISAFTYHSKSGVFGF
ncbi:MAG: type IX secretion system membrane protein PorP/SprF [Cyclobacteriaceae bacterium]|nr:type IX secretion system membrane protein PorP/SprF [Cyclobacteriaceae bacterium]